MSDKCRSCGDPIIFGVHERTGKRMPLNPRPVPGGNVWVVDHRGSTLVVAVASKSVRPPEGVETYISHFAVCPNSKQHRRKGAL